MLVCSAVARIKVLSLGPLPEAQRHRVRCVIILLCVEVLVVCTALGSHPVSVDNRVKSSRYTCGSEDRPYTGRTTATTSFVFFVPPKRSSKRDIRARRRGFSPHIAAGLGRTDESYRVAHAARRAVNATAVGASPAQLFLQYRPEAAGDKTFFVGD